MTRAQGATEILAEFDQPWRGGSPVFGCCRRTVAVALDLTDLQALREMDVTNRVESLRSAVESELPGHLDSHRCCLGHLADLAFDLPELLPVEQTTGV